MHIIYTYSVIKETSLVANQLIRGKRLQREKLVGDPAPCGIVQPKSGYFASIKFYARHIYTNIKRTYNNRYI